MGFGICRQRGCCKVNINNPYNSMHYKNHNEYDTGDNVSLHFALTRCVSR